MMRTLFVEGLSNRALGGINDIQVNFRETSFVYKPKNMLIRTTLAMKDLESSDTVSTEFNYL